ncbi:MAG: class I SAM-dependent methyltransferase [Anaerolineae bacterium]
MSLTVEYDAFADIYEIWATTAPVTARNLPFYVEVCRETPGLVAELGVGDGRIAIEVARAGKPIIGIDSSSQMLQRCRARAQAAGVLDRLSLIQADFRDFKLPQPAELITVPFHSIGHLVTLDDKREGLRHIYQQLAPGGRLIFDHFVFDLEAARSRYGVAHLRAEYVHPDTGRDTLLWVTSRYEPESQTIRIIAWTDEIDGVGVLVRRQYRRLSFSWLEPEQTRALLEETGFEIEALYGDFDRSPFTPDSPEQIWVARRPAGEG